MGKPTPLFVGLDVHKDSVAVAHAMAGRTDPPVFVGPVGPREADLDRLIRRLQGKTTDLCGLCMKPARVAGIVNLRRPRAESPDA